MFIIYISDIHFANPFLRSAGCSRMLGKSRHDPSGRCNSFPPPTPYYLPLQHPFDGFRNLGRVRLHPRFEAGHNFSVAINQKLGEVPLNIAGDGGIRRTHREWSTGPSEKWYYAPMRTRVIVLGAGFGGLELTTILSDAFGEAIDIVLIDKGDAFVFGFSKLDVMFRRQVGGRGPSSLP